MQRRTMLGGLMAAVLSPLMFMVRGSDANEIQRVVATGQTPKRLPRDLLGAWDHDRRLFIVRGTPEKCREFFMAYESILWPESEKPEIRAVFMAEYLLNFQSSHAQGVGLFYASMTLPGKMKGLYERAVTHAIVQTRCTVLLDEGSEAGAAFRLLSRNQGDCHGLVWGSPRTGKRPIAAACWASGSTPVALS